MAPETPRESDIVCLPVTPERLADLDRFSRQNGKFRYCSCMRWRLTSTQYHHSTKESRIAALDELVLQRAPVGILAYIHNDPIGWCSVGPRESFAALERFRALPRLDAAPVWSIVCFFVSSQARRHGITLELLRAAIAYASSQGATIIEGYPVQPGPHLYTYMGAPSTFLAAGFTDVTPPGHARTVMRYFVPLHT